MSPVPHARRLILSIHDVAPRFEAEVDILAARLERLLGERRFALLVVPDHWGTAPISASPAFQRKLRGWAEAGAEIFVHGWFHRDDADHSGGVARFKARRLTAGEGEFLGLDRAEAMRRMIAGRDLIEGITGRPSRASSLRHGFMAKAPRPLSRMPAFRWPRIICAYGGPRTAGRWREGQ
jgi:hypothetical protein